MRYSARYLFFIVLFLFLPLFLHAQVFADGTGTYDNSDLNTNVPNNLHTWTQSVLIEVLSAANCQLAGIDTTRIDGECLSPDPTTGKLGISPTHGGAIGFMGGMISTLYQPPIHTSDYFQYLSGNFGIAKKTYADNGVGFTSIQPLLKIWTTFRDLAYLFFVVVFVILGFAIMLRVKIDPRTVMSIQNQIPKIIIALLLITFSFAIAGFLIDLMYVAIYMIFNLANTIIISIGGDPKLQAEVLNKISSTQRTFNGDNPIGIFNNLVGFIDIATSAAGSLKDIVASLFSGLSGIPIIGFALNGIVASLAFFIIVIAVLWAMFQVWFSLLKAYIYILVDVVLGPFFIITGIIPGSKLGFTGWLRDMGANLSAFPVTIALMLFGEVFIDAAKGTSGTLFVPPLIGNPGGDAKPISYLIGLGVILIAPKALEMTKAFFKAPEFKYTQAIGQALKVGQAGTGAILGGVKGTLFKRDQYGGAIGAGSTLIDRKFTGPIVRSLFGLHSGPHVEKTAERSAEGWRKVPGIGKFFPKKPTDKKPPKTSGAPTEFSS